VTVAFAVFFDACTLVPINLTDLLLRLAEAGLYRPLWSADVLTEVQRTLPEVATAMTPAKAAHRVAVMRAAFPDAEVTGYESLIPVMTNAEKDRHVLAAAVRGGAAAIVTANLSDFPPEARNPYDIAAVHPDGFLLDQLELSRGPTRRCLHELVAARQRPPRPAMSSSPTSPRPCHASARARAEAIPHSTPPVTLSGSIPLPSKR
jgi:predicted nucleic acid-binding protein